ncbi:MAG: T9SS type A sorting domain-containing protein [candidate division WOR-3 bacterium]
MVKRSFLSTIILLGNGILVEVCAQRLDTLWTRAYGGYYPEYGYSVKQTYDGGFICVGITMSYGNGGYDAWLLKLNTGGDTVWTKTYGGNYDDAGYQVIQTSDGDYVIVGKKNNYGTTYDDVWLLKVNSNGDTLWTKAYGGPHNDYGRSIQQTSDGGYIIAGGTCSFGQGTPTYWNIYLIKTDNQGDTTWTKVYGEDGFVDDIAYSVIQTTDGGYLICGCTGLHPQYDLYLIKTDSNGNVLWTKKYGGTGQEIGYSVIESNGSYLAAGYTNSYPPNPSNFYLLKLNPTGDTIWTKKYDLGGDEHGHCIKEAYDGGYIITGFTYLPNQYAQDICLVRIDFNGDVIWTKIFQKADHFDDAVEIQRTDDNGYIIVGYTQFLYWDNRANEQLYLVRTQPETAVEERVSDNETKISFYIYPNFLTNNKIVIKYYLNQRALIDIAVYDILGKRVRHLLTTYAEADEYKLSWDGKDDYHNNLPAGIYFIKCNNVARKLVKTK